MRFTAQVNNRLGEHEASISIDGQIRRISIPPKENAPGSSISGGELLFLAMATCYCNDLYREAAKRNIKVKGVSVTVEGEFGSPGEPAKWIAYSTNVDAGASEDEIRELIRHTDTVTEIQNTIRTGVPVELRMDQPQL